LNEIKDFDTKFLTGHQQLESDEKIQFVTEDIMLKSKTTLDEKKKIKV